MRFSAAFTLPLSLPVPPQPAVGAHAGATDTAVPTVPAARVQPEVPDDLDARVRLVGEWQLGEPD